MDFLSAAACLNFHLLFTTDDSELGTGIAAFIYGADHSCMEGLPVLFYCRRGPGVQWKFKGRYVPIIATCMTHTESYLCEFINQGIVRSQ